MRHIPYQDKATEMYERHKEAIEDKLGIVIDHIEDIGELLNKIDDEELIDEINYHLSKIIGQIDEI